VREKRLERIKWENKVRANQLAELQMPQRLLERARDQKLGLVPPSPGQMVWLVEPPVAERTNATSQLLVLRK
jgi:hypothetical protein